MIIVARFGNVDSTQEVLQGSMVQPCGQFVNRWWWFQYVRVFLVVGFELGTVHQHLKDNMYHLFMKTRERFCVDLDDIPSRQWIFDTFSSSFF